MGVFKKVLRATAIAAATTLLCAATAAPPAMADQNVDCGWRGILPVKYKNCSLSKRHVYYWLGVFPDGNRFCINVPPKETVTIPIVAYAHEGPFNNYC